MNKDRYYAIDGLRAYSAIGIVLMHVLTNGGYKIEGFVFERLIPAFTNFVFLYMIISGFGVCCGYYEKVVNNNFDIKSFYEKRYKKIWPYFTMLCGLEFVISPSLNSLYEVFANLTLCFGLLSNANITVIGVGWFLGVVFVFYLVFPFFCYLLSEKHRAWFSFVIALIFNVLCTIYFDVGRTNFVYCAVFFLAGGLIFLYKEQISIMVEKYKWLVVLFFVVFIVAYFVIGALVPIMIGLFSIMLIYAIGVQRNGILQNRVTKFLSEISMEIYLAHMVVYRIFEKANLIYLFELDVLSYVVTSVGTLGGVIVFVLITKSIMRMIKSMCSPIKRLK